MNLKLTAVTFLTLFSALAFAEDPQTYHYFARIPQTQLSCKDEANALAARFTAATQIAVTAATCTDQPTLTAEGQSYQLYSLDLTYQVLPENVPSQYTAILGDAQNYGIANRGNAYYDTYAACLADIAAQSTMYAAQTQLSAVAAYCVAETDLDTAQYSMKLESFGTPAARLYGLDIQSDQEFSDPIAAPGTNSSKPFYQAVVGLLLESGAKITRSTDTMVAYYAATEAAVSQTELGYFDNADECTAQLPQVHALFIATGATDVYQVCQPLSDDANAKTVSLQVAYNSFDMVESDEGYNSQNYYSFQECMNDSARAFAAASQTMQKALGGLCIPDEMHEGQYVFEVFGTL
jgi:hypothetical protein